MLKQNTPYISVFKLLSGEEFICKVIEETADSYHVLKPLTIGQSPQGVQFIPIMMLANHDKHVIIPKPVIVGQPADEIESQYEIMTTGIALPKKSSIIST